MNTIPVIDQSGKIFPVAGDIFAIAPGITIQIAAYSEVDIISPKYGVVGTIGGTNVYISGVDNDNHFRVAQITYS